MWEGLNFVKDSDNRTMQISNENINTEMKNNPLMESMQNHGYCPMFYDPIKKQFDIYITGQILDIGHYLNALDALTFARVDDKIFIYIDSPGGAVSTGSIIASNIHRCEAEVTTVGRGIVASAAALIFSAGHKQKVEPYANFMYHMSKHMDMGNSLKIMDRARLTAEYVQKCLLAESVAKGHITVEELEIISTSTDEVWVSAKKMSKRILGIKDNSEPEVHDPTVSKKVPFEKPIFSGE